MLKLLSLFATLLISIFAPTVEDLAFGQEDDGNVEGAQNIPDVNAQLVMKLQLSETQP